MAMQGCTSDPYTGTGEWDGEGTLLNLSVSFGGMSTRLAELSAPEDMNDDTINDVNYGLKNVGLYIYYTSDYDNDYLEAPYVRNLECEIDGNTLVPILEQGQTDIDKNIYIYDRMTIVAFYPYNADMSLEENYFRSKADENSYYITRQDYSEQYYIPYRAQAETNPTTAYYTRLPFYPKSTYKVEIVIVSDDPSVFVSADDVVILPNIDPITTDTGSSTDGKRYKWYDGTPKEYDNRGGGSNVRQYWTYIWTTDDDPNDIPRGEILLEAGDLTLIASQDVYVQEQYVYRYGYNMSTGEIFIPTSTDIVWDAQSLADYKGGSGEVSVPTYQVCDIDLDGISWEPNVLSLGRYDGGGHKILNLDITSSSGNVGLFSKVTYNSVVCNVNLIAPAITVNSAEETVAVGAICGQLNDELTEEEIADLMFNLPEGLSEVVKAAIIADLLADAFNGTSRIVACRVEDPVITVTGNAPRVGTICGSAGARNDDGEYKSVIKDTYSLGGILTVNTADESLNAGGYVGGFCGLNNGTILRSYCTITDDDITFNIAGVASYKGFTTMGTLFTASEGAVLTDDYSIIADTQSGVSQMPGSWPSWTSATEWWPVLTTGWLTDDTSYWYSPGNPTADYPILQWERR